MGESKHEPYRHRPVAVDPFPNGLVLCERCLSPWPCPSASAAFASSRGASIVSTTGSLDVAAWGEFERGADGIWRVSSVTQAAIDNVHARPSSILDRTLAEVMHDFGPSLSYEDRLAAIEALAVGQSIDFLSNGLQTAAGEHLWNWQRWTRISQTRIRVILLLMPQPAAT